MPAEPSRDARDPGRYAVLATVAAWLILITGLLVMLGWWLDLPVLRNLAPGLATMKFNTALCFALAGTALLFAARSRAIPAHRWMAMACAGLALLLALMSGAEYLLPVDFGLDQLLARDLLTDPSLAPPGRMSLATAGYFVLLGLALLLLDTGVRHWPRPAPLLAALVAVGGFIGLLGYLFGVPVLYGFGPYSTMAVHTSALFFIAGWGVLFTRPRNGFMSVLSSPLVGGLLTRRFLPPLAVAIVGFAWVRLQAQHAGYFGTEFGLALMATFSVSCVLVATLLAAKHLNTLHGRLVEQLRLGAHFTAIVESSQDAIVGKSLEGIVTSWNPGAEQMFGYSAAEMLGQTIRRIIPPERLDEEDSILARIGRGERVVPFQTRRLRKDGNIIPVSVTVSPIIDESGRVTGASKIGRDISELIAAQNDLTRSNKDLEQFAFSASHDLQEPLRAVAGCLQVLERRSQGQLDESAQELIRHSVDGAKRMQMLIDGLLAYSRVGTRGGAFQPVDSARSLDAALVNLAAILEESGGEIVRGQLPYVQADPLQMIQLFQNLVGNALKFRGTAPPRVEVGATRQAGWWLFSVRDNGIGFDPKFAERVFIIFQRLHTRTEYPGTGIGLALCRKIVERHGGRIWAESTPGQGATFHFTLPAADPPDTAQVPTP